MVGYLSVQDQIKFNTFERASVSKILYMLVKMYVSTLVLLLLLVNRVHTIMIRDANKDPTTNPNASLAKLLIDQVFLSWLILQAAV